jgi:hypothetical protein
VFHGGGRGEEELVQCTQFNFVTELHNYFPSENNNTSVPGYQAGDWYAHTSNFATKKIKR